MVGASVCGGISGQRQMLTKSFDDLILGLVARDALLHFAILEYHQRGHAHHVVLHSNIRVVVNIQFDDLDGIAPFSR